MPKSLILLALVLIAFFALVRYLQNKGTCLTSRREAALLAVTFFGSFFVLIAEVLSVFGRIDRKALLFSWGLVLFIASLLVIWLSRAHLINDTISFLKDLKDRRRWQEISKLQLVMIALILFQVVTLAMVAHQYAPNNYDSMTYHLPRVMHWQQNHSIAHYATSIDRQVQMPPFSEFMLLHLQVIFRHDRYANLVQWFAMVISVVGMTAITRRLGGNSLQQTIAGLLCATIPMGTLQATSTQNDYVLAAALVLFVLFILALIEAPSNWLYTAGAGVALGLALLTKGTAYIFAGAIGITFFGYSVYKYGKTAFIRWVLIGSIALTLNAGHYLRNFEIYRSPLVAGNDYVNEVISPGAVLSNGIRNAAFHVPIVTGIGVIDRASTYAMSWLRLLHEYSGFSPVDPRLTWPGNPDIFSQYTSSYHEDFAGNPIHAILILMGAVGAFAVLGAYPEKMLVRLLAIAIVLAYTFLSAYLKWQIWGARLQLPLFVLGCALPAVTIFRRPHPYLQLALIIAAFFSLNWTFTNWTRPIDTAAAYNPSVPSAGYFTKNQEFYSGFVSVTDKIAHSGCQNVGLVLGSNSYEYPWWIMLRERGFTGRIEHINVQNETKILEYTDFKPCAIIVEGTLEQTTKDFLVFSFHPFSLYIDRQPGL